VFKIVLIDGIFQNKCVFLRQHDNKAAEKVGLLHSFLWREYLKLIVKFKFNLKLIVFQYNTTNQQESPIATTNQQESPPQPHNTTTQHNHTTSQINRFQLTTCPTISPMSSTPDPWGVLIELEAKLKETLLGNNRAEAWLDTKTLDYSLKTLYLL
jgi:hypothetical protein